MASRLWVPKTTPLGAARTFKTLAVVITLSPIRNLVEMADEEEEKDEDEDEELEDCEEELDDDWEEDCEELQLDED